MIPSATKMQTLSVTLRFLLSRLRTLGSREQDIDQAALRDSMRKALDALPEGDEAKGVFQLSAKQLPWYDTGIDVSDGDVVTLLAGGRIVLNKLLDLWFGPNFQLWVRVGEDGEVFSGKLDTQTFTATNTGRLFLAIGGMAEWETKQGHLSDPAPAYKGLSGGLSVAAIRWAEGDASAGLRRLIDAGDPGGLGTSELNRLENENKHPSGWHFLWFLGPSAAYSESTDPDGRASVHCETRRDVGILQKPVEMALTPGTRLSWRWKVDELPSDFAEYTLPTHDYLSIAVEFDNGEDITYYWSSEIPPETIYRCPLPNWNHRETHVVIRSGREGLGQWLEESRDVYADCERAYGDAPKNIVAVWFIANSLLQRKPGVCEYSDIQLSGNGETIQVV